MIRRVCLLGLLVVTVGCAAPDLTKGQGSVPPTSPASDLPVPDPTVKSRVALVRSGRSVKVGDTPSAAFGVFGPPPRAWDFREMPPSLAPPYGARGWETTREGFGVITYNDVVVAAMRQIDDAPPSQLAEILQEHEAALGVARTEFVAGTQVRYWFWEDGPHRLMVSALNRPRGELHVTVAMGDRAVLDILGISPAKATDDSLRVEEIMRERNPAQPPEGSSSPE